MPYISFCTRGDRHHFAPTKTFLCCFMATPHPEKSLAWLCQRISDGTHSWFKSGFKVPITVLSKRERGRAVYGSNMCNTESILSTHGVWSIPRSSKKRKQAFFFLPKTCFRDLEKRGDRVLCLPVALRIYRPPQLLQQPSNWLDDIRMHPDLALLVRITEAFCMWLARCGVVEVLVWKKL